MDSILAQQFSSLEAAREALDGAAKEEGFALAVHRKRPSAANPISVELRCSKGRVWRDQGNEAIPEAKRRKTSTQMTGCGYRIMIRWSGVSWAAAAAGTASHNHDLLAPAAHAKYRYQTVEKYREKILEDHNSGISPALIVSRLRGRAAEDPEVEGITKRQVYNVIARHRVEELAGRTPLQYLYDLLEDSRYFFRDSRRDGRLYNLFIAPRYGLELWRRFPDLLVLDCTYRTNRFKMPLLNICGSTPQRKTFSVAAVFLSSETEADYRWALEKLRELAEKEGIRLPKITVTDREIAILNALASLFPSAVHLLCRWHIRQNILAKCKGFFPKASKQGSQTVRAPAFEDFLRAWEGLAGSPDEATFKSRLRDFRAPGRHLENAVKYAIKTWIEPWKDKFVAYLVDRHRHYGHTTSSIVEGLHSKMKLFLGSSGGDLTTVFHRFEAFWKDQSREIESFQLNSLQKISTWSLKPLYTRVRERVWSGALERLREQEQTLSWNAEEKRFREPSGRCDARHPCAFKTSYGVPCRHEIYRRSESGLPFQREDFADFWHHDPPPGLPGRPEAPLEPLEVRGKGRPRGALNLDRSRSTRRLASAHEIAEAQERAEARRRPSPSPPLLDLLPPLPPPSTAPAALRDQVRGTASGLRYVQTHGDSFEPGTQAPRRYQRRRTPDSEDELAGEQPAAAPAAPAAPAETDWVDEEIAARRRRRRRNANLNRLVDDEDLEVVEIASDEAGGASDSASGASDGGLESLESIAALPYVDLAQEASQDAEHQTYPSAEAAADPWGTLW